MRRIVQCVVDLTGGSLNGLRVLDLGCGEGLYAIEFARHGASCVGIEGREANIEKGRFVKRALGLDNLEFRQGDVRGLSVEAYGTFDVVLCLGILYHLDAADVFAFIGKLAEVCRRVCIVDTRVTLSPKEVVVNKGTKCWGTRGEEHDPGDSKEVKARRLKASLDNDYNFWLTRPSLFNALGHVGFSSVYECCIPVEPKKLSNRITVAAIKGKCCSILSAPLMASYVLNEMPERPVEEFSPTMAVLRKLSHLLPSRGVRRMGRKLLGRDDPLT